MNKEREQQLNDLHIMAFEHEIAEQKKLEDYKTRNEKAIEKLKFYRGKLINTYVIGYADIDDLLNILQGSDKE